MKVILLSLYLFYMFTIFKTTISFFHPLEFYMINRLDNYFYHMVGDTEYSNKICEFGKSAIIFLIGYLVISEYCITEMKKYSKYVLVITLIMSLLNLNSFVYLIPYFIYESTNF